MFESIWLEQTRTSSHKLLQSFSISVSQAFSNCFSSFFFFFFFLLICFSFLSWPSFWIYLLFFFSFWISLECFITKPIFGMITLSNHFFHRIYFIYLSNTTFFLYVQSLKANRLVKNNTLLTDSCYLFWNFFYWLLFIGLSCRCVYFRRLWTYFVLTIWLLIGMD